MAVMFPMAGVVRRVGYQQQPPFGCPGANNVRPDDVMLRRKRGGSRPGLGLFDPVLMGSGNPVRLLDYVTVSDTNEHIHDPDFTGAAWVTNAYMSGGLPDSWTDRGGILNSPGDDGVKYGGVIKSPGITASSPYTLRILTVPNPDYGTYAPAGSRYELLARMNNTTPAPTSSGLIVRVDLVQDGATVDVSYDIIVNGSSATSGTSNNLPLASAWLSLFINGNDITVYWGKTALKSAYTISAHSGQTAVGYAIESITGAE